MSTRHPTATSTRATTSTRRRQRVPNTRPPGVKAVMVSLQRGLEQMGPVRTAATLSRLNQRHGFDCPGCAWPEEPGGRKLAEFCENGAKAVAEEATKTRVTPEFFARHSVADLAEQPEYWLSQQGRLTHPMVLRPGDTHYRPIAGTTPTALIADHLNAPGQPRTRRCSTPPGAPATRRRSSTNCWSAASAPTTCRTAPTCATNPRARRWPTRSASARVR